MAGFSCFAESTLCAGADAGFSAGLAGFESVLSEGAASGAGSALLEVTSLDGFEGFDASAGLGASAAFAGDGSAAGFPLLLSRRRLGGLGGGSGRGILRR